MTTLTTIPAGVQSIAIKNIQGLAVRRSLTGQSLTDNVIISNDGKLIVSAGGEDVRLWDFTSGNLLRTLAQYARSTSLSPDGSILALSGSTTLWQVNSGTLLRELSAGNSNSVAFSPNGKILAVGSFSPFVQLWDVSSGQQLNSIQHVSGVTSVAFSPDGQFVAAGAQTSSIKLWNIANQAVKDLSGGDQNLSFSRDGRMLVSNNSDSAFIVDVTQGQVLHTFHARGFVKGVALSSDGQLVATTDGGALIFWSAITGQVIRTIDVVGGDYSVAGVTFSPDGRFVVTGGRAVRIWGIQ